MSTGQRIQNSIMEASSKDYVKNQNKLNKKFVIKHSTKQKKVMVQMRKQIIMENKVAKKLKSETRKTALVIKKNLNNMKKVMVQVRKRKPMKKVKEVKEVKEVKKRRTKNEMKEAVMKKEMERREKFDIQFKKKFE